VRTSARNALLGYLKQSEKPLQSLVFVLPLIIIHEIGWRYSHRRLLAFYLLHRFFAMFGATGTFVPALALIVMLLSWHVFCRDKWTVQLNTILWMYLESVLLALPLLALAAGMARWQTGPMLANFGPGLADSAIIPMGAGIYEEMIFRLLGLTLLSILFVDVLGMKKSRATLLMVVVSGVLFSLYHYLGPEKFVWKTCLFRTVAGIYFAAIFLCRGFGVTAGSHAVYDMIVCAAAGIG
jgi:CAAX prenyl protease-like protein